MTNPQLRRALLDKLHVTPQAVSQRIQRLKRLVPMSTQDGWYTEAAMEGIDISRFLESPEVDKIRGLVGEVRDRTETPHSQTIKTRNDRPSRKRSAQIAIAPDLHVDDPLLSQTIAAEAKFMAERIYPMVYLLENSMRAFIIRIMLAAHGKDWWDTCVPARVKNPVAGRMKKEERTHWHGKRGAHPIYYSDTAHLVDIVETNWDEFAAYLPNKEFFVQRLWEINVSRRVVAHNNPLAANDRKRLEVYFNDWELHISGIAPSLP